jgi:hypothetical protein
MNKHVLISFLKDLYFYLKYDEKNKKKKKLKKKKIKKKNK